ncbi:MAG: hypothetical protein U0271_02530 [Polyangiaceae bacterium]
MSLFARWLGLTLLVSVASPIAVAAAGEPGAGEVSADDLSQRRDAARDLARRGLQKVDAGDVAGGLPLLLEAEAKFHAPTHLLFIAQAYAALGKLGSAGRYYEALLREALPDYAPEEFRQARDLGRTELDALWPRIPKIRLVLENAAPSDARVALDGKSIQPSTRERTEQSAFLLVDADEPHEITVEVRTESRGGRVTVREGETQELRLAFSPEPKRTAEPSTPPPPYLTPGIIVLGTGAAGLIVGAVTGILSLQKVDELNDRCPTHVDCDPRFQPLADDARLLGDVSTGLFVVGGVAAVAGIVLLAWPAPKPQSANTQTSRGLESSDYGLRLVTSGLGLALEGGWQ